MAHTKKQMMIQVMMVMMMMMNVRFIGEGKQKHRCIQ